MRANRPILLASQLRKSFGGQVVLDSVNVSLCQGEVVLLRGDNGSGKTTLLNILTGNLAPDSGVIRYDIDSTPRYYRFPRTWWSNLNPLDHFTPEFVSREGVGRTWQDVRLFRSHTLNDNISVSEPHTTSDGPLWPLIHPRGWTTLAAAQAERADAVLLRLGLRDKGKAFANEISLGESKRVAIARAVASGARVLFLDEPLAGLDSRGILAILEMLGRLVADHAMTLVVVEHLFNQPYLSKLITTDWLLANGTIASASTAARFSGIEMEARPWWYPLLVTPADDVQEIDLPRGARLWRILRRTPSTEPRPTLLALEGLLVSRSGRTVIGLSESGTPSGLDLVLLGGETIVLEAPNGWGKSTLFDALAGFCRVDAGTIRLLGVSVNALRPWRRTRKGLRMFPAVSEAFSTLTVAEIARLAGGQGVPKDLWQYRHRVSSSLSGGERQRVSLLTVAPGQVNVYDEPFSSLDGAGSLAVAAALDRNPNSANLILVPGRGSDREEGRR